MNYWFSSKNKVQLHFRHQKISQQFIPEGGSLSDVGLSSDLWLESNFALSASVQYERWLVPVIQRNPSRNVAAALQFTFRPGKWFSRSALVIHP